MEQAGERALFTGGHVQNFGEQVRLDETDKGDQRDGAEAAVAQRDKIPAGDAGLKLQRSELEYFYIIRRHVEPLRYSSAILPSKSETSWKESNGLRTAALRAEMHPPETRKSNSAEEFSGAGHRFICF